MMGSPLLKVVRKGFRHYSSTAEAIDQYLQHHARIER